MLSMNHEDDNFESVFSFSSYFSVIMTRFGDLITDELEMKWGKHLPMQAFDKLVAREKVFYYI